MGKLEKEMDARGWDYTIVGCDNNAGTQVGQVEIEAARLSGIRTGRVKYLVFALSGFFAGLAGLVLLSRVNSGMGNAGLGYEFKVITCVVLGGVSVAGGSGRMSGVIAGTFIISALNNGMVLINLNSWIQNIVLDIVLVLAVGFDCYQKKKQAN